MGTCLEGLASAGGFAEIRLEVALDGALVADAEVETQIQVVSHLRPSASTASAACSCRSGGLFVHFAPECARTFAFGSGIFRSLFAGFLRAEDAAQVEVVDLVAPSEHEVLGAGFGELGAGHAQVQHAGCLVLHLEGHVVVQGGVDADEWREALVDADCADIEEAVGDVAAAGGVLYEAESAGTHALYPRTV